MLELGSVHSYILHNEIHLRPELHERFERAVLASLPADYTGSQSMLDLHLFENDLDFILAKVIAKKQMKSNSSGVNLR